MADGAADVKPDINTITIRVRESDGSEVFFKVKKTTKLNKLFQAYAQRKTVDASSLRFSFDGTRVQAEDTPESLGMDDNDQLDVNIEQTGGF